MSTPNSKLRKPFDHRHLYLVLLYVSYSGAAVSQVFWRAAVFEFLFSLLTATAAAYWTITDARRRGKPIPHSMQMLILFFWPLAVPIYLIASRGLRGFGWALLNALALVMTWTYSFYAVYFVVYSLGIL